MTIEELEQKGLIIYKTLSGSKLYGIDTPESDTDMKGVFMLPLDMILSGQYIEQISDDKHDVVYYELGRYINLLKSSNPNMLESLFAPADAVLRIHPIMDMILNERDRFITKECNNSLIGYAKSQLTKASGLNKMMNWEKDKVTRKGVLDFCYVAQNHGSILLTDWLQERGLKQEYCGLVNIPNMRYTYGLYYDYVQHAEAERFTNDEFFDQFGDTPYGYTLKKYKGIVKNPITSNDISLSAVPKTEDCLTTMIFNKDGYQTSCKAFGSYTTWLKERNTSRYVDINEHGQSYDGKNLGHMIRLIHMGREIASGQGMNVKRINDREQLLAIRKGKVDLKLIIDEADEMMKDIDELFAKSTLPDSIDPDFCNNLLLKMRKEMYVLR